MPSFEAIRRRVSVTERFEVCGEPIAEDAFGDIAQELHFGRIEDRKTQHSRFC